MYMFPRMLSDAPDGKAQGQDALLGPVDSPCPDTGPFVDEQIRFTEVVGEDSGAASTKDRFVLVQLSDNRQQVTVREIW